MGGPIVGFVSEFDVAKLKPGTKSEYTLALFETVGRMLSLDVLVVKGCKPGSTLMATAGVHGDEYEGMFAVRNIYAELDPNKMAGTFIGIPVCNTLAFENLSRETPAYADGLNLARVFPGDPQGSYTQKLAYELLQLALRNLRLGKDVIVDLHSSGTPYDYVPMMGAHVTANFEKEKELSRVTGITNLWELNKNPKSLNGAASDAGLLSLGGEIAGRGGAKSQDIEIYTNVLRNLCGFLKIAPYSYKVCEGNFLPVHTQKFTETGLFVSDLELGCTLHKGDKVGTLYDHRGEVLQTINAACDGTLWGIRRKAAVYAGEVAYLLAK